MIEIDNRTPHSDRKVRELIRAAMGEDWERRPSPRHLQNYIAATGQKTDGRLDAKWLVIHVKQRRQNGKTRTDLGETRLHFPGRTFRGHFDHFDVNFSVLAPSAYPWEGYSYGDLPIHFNSWQEELFHHMAHENWHLWHVPDDHAGERYGPDEIVAEDAALRKLRAARQSGLFGKPARKAGGNGTLQRIAAFLKS